MSDNTKKFLSFDEIFKELEDVKDQENLLQIFEKAEVISLVFLRLGIHYIHEKTGIDLKILEKINWIIRKDYYSKKGDI